QCNPGKYVGPRRAAEPENLLPSSSHVWLLRIVAGEFQGIVNFYRTTDFRGPAVIERPTAVASLVSAQIRSEFALEFVIDLAQVVHHQDIFGGNGAIGLELIAPVAIGMLGPQQSVGRVANCALNSGQWRFIGGLCFRPPVIEPSRAVLHRSRKARPQTALSSAPAPCADERMLDVRVNGKPKVAA